MEKTIDNGYIKLFRKFFEGEFWQIERIYSKAEAWIDLMEMARWGSEPTTRTDSRGQYTLHFGDIYLSYRFLGIRWKWSKNKVRHFLETLEGNQSISFKKRDSHRTIVSLTNLKTYLEWESGKKDSKGTVKGQSRDSEGTKKKPLDPVKPLKPKTLKNFSSDSDEYRLADYLYKNILKNNPKHKEPNLQSWAKDVDKMIRIDKRSVDDIKNLIDWVQKDFFWKANVLSPAKLREKFDQLTAKKNNSYSGNNSMGYNEAEEKRKFIEGDFGNKPSFDMEIKT